MSEHVINISDNYGVNLKESVKVSCDSSRLKGHVSAYHKDKNGKLIPIFEKQNMIVFGGREWLLRRAFGTSLPGNDASIYDKTITWFGIGNGGGEPGNPLQAGPTYGQDTGLYQPVRMRSDLTISDPGYAMYGSDYDGNHGYYKKFSNVTIREDRGNPYTVGGLTLYPPLIAEIRIELSSDDANGGAYEDLNEACLFVADPSDPDPGASYAATGQEIGTENVLKVVTDNDYAIYYMDTYDLASDVPGLNIGDYLWVYKPGDPNEIAEAAPAMIVDIYNGESAVRKGYIVVEKPGAVDSDYSSNYPVAHMMDKTINPYVCFSRVSFSTIRKTVDREIVFLWKIYF